MFSSLIKIKNQLLEKRWTDYNPKSFWIVTVQDCSKTSLDNAHHLLGILNFINVIDIDNLLVKNAKKISY